MITISVGFGDESESDPKNLEKTEEIGKLLEGTTEITVELDPKDLRELLYGSADHLTGISGKNAVVIKTSLQVGKTNMGCEVFSVV